MILLNKILKTEHLQRFKNLQVKYSQIVIVFKMIQLMKVTELAKNHFGIFKYFLMILKRVIQNILNNLLCFCSSNII